MTLIILLVAGSVFFLCYSSKDSYYAQKMNIAKADRELKDLQNELKELEDRYDSELTASLTENYDINYTRVKRDKSILSDVANKSFEYTSGEKYRKNREEVLKYLSPDSAFMSEFFFEDDKEDSVVDAMGIKRKCQEVDVYYSGKDDDTDVYHYFIYVRSIPYFADDISDEASLHAEQYLIEVSIDSDHNITRFDSQKCYVN